jgi:hypothetical protein
MEEEDGSDWMVYNVVAKEMSLYLRRALNGTYLRQNVVSTLAQTLPIMDWHRLYILALLVC